MRKLTLILVLALTYTTAVAQTEVNYDQEKLLEYYQTQRYSEAAQYLESIYPANLQDVKALGQIAYCYMMSGRLPDAEVKYLKIIEQQPDDLPVMFSLANINLKRGNNQQAKTYFERIVKLDSSNFRAIKQLAGLYLTENDSLHVLYLEKANQLIPVEADVAYDLATAYRKLKKYEPAYEVLSIAIAADTGNFILQQLKLPIAIQLKKFNEVVSVGERLLKTGSDANVVKDVGLAHYYLKNYGKAISFFKMLETADMQTETTLYFTALSYRNLKNYKLATDYTKRTIDESISTNISSYYALLGTTYEENGQVTPAVTAFKSGLQYKNNASIFYSLGLIYDLKLKQKTNALKYYNLYLGQKPDAKEEKDQIAYVKDRIAALKIK